MHNKTGSFQVFFLCGFGKSLQQFSNVIVVEVDVGLFGVMDCLVPLDEEQLIVLVDVSKVADPHSLELLLDLAHVAIAVFVFAVSVQGTEDVD